jgi:ribose 5-phosphate isomerase A
VAQDPFAELKRQAAVAAVAHVESGMKLGLGTGSTAFFAVEEVGARLRRGELRDLVCVPTSTRTAEHATRLGIPLASLDAFDRLDLAIDGADEVDPRCDLIKGGGGALLREKAVERKADRLYIIVDHGKLSPRLGTRFALPVEVEPAAWRGEAEVLAGQGCSPVLRRAADQPYVTDNGNYILDCRFERGIADSHALAAALDARPAVRAHGLFLDMTTEVIVAAPEGLRTLLPR